MSTRYYLPLRHYVLIKYIVKTIITKNHPNERLTNINLQRKLEIRNTDGTFQ